jgi:glycosyltransferase involved in cell wall biosynthesis
MTARDNMRGCYNTDRPIVSVVICTYSRKNFLRDCLDSIYNQDYPKSSFEVIIVDGGSTDGTRELCKKYPGIRFVTEKRYGLAFARNKGAELAQGSIVAYTDDDCITDRHWLANLVAGFDVSNTIVGVGGPVYPLHPELFPAKILVKAAFGLFDEGKFAKLVQGLLTSNSAYRREIFNRIRFDEALGVTRRNKLILSGEDDDFCDSLTESGQRLLYSPQARVYHQIRKERLHVQYIVKHAIHSGISKTRCYLKKKRSGIWAIRYSTAQLLQYSVSSISDRSFTSCYNLVYSLSTLFFSVVAMVTLSHGI